MRARCGYARIGAILGLLCAHGVARADEPSDQDKAVATTLFDDGHALMAAGQIDEACAKLAESRRLDPLPGTILNLATCHEKQGRTASAMAEFREARALAERDHRDDRVAFANEHMKAIEPRLSMLVIVVAPENGADTSVSLDGAALRSAVWGTKIPVDPGPHALDASAPGKVSKHVEVTIAADGEVQTLQIPPLDPVPPPLAVAPPPATILPPELPPAEPPAPAHGLSSRRTWALVAGGAGVLGLGAGAFFGVRAIEKHDDPQATCTTTPCSTTSMSLNNQAKFAADAATVSFIVGASALGVGAYLWLSDSVAVAPGVARIDLSARF